MQTLADVLTAIEKTSHIMDNEETLTIGKTRRVIDANGNTVGKWEVITRRRALSVAFRTAHGHYDATNLATHQWKAR